MINLDQLQLLEAKIESAVEKISQLQVENDALRNRVQELSNALSAKSEQLSIAEQKLTDSEKSQELIESGILKALNRLNSIENSVLKSNGDSSVSKPIVSTQTIVESPREVSDTTSDDATVNTISDNTIQANFETEDTDPFDESSDSTESLDSNDTIETSDTSDMIDTSDTNDTIESNESDLPESEIEIPVDSKPVSNPFESTSYEPNPFEANPFENEKSDVPGFDIF